MKNRNKEIACGIEIKIGIDETQWNSGYRNTLKLKRC